METLAAEKCKPLHYFEVPVADIYNAHLCELKRRKLNADEQVQ
jgi:hypothetical protein